MFTEIIVLGGLIWKYCSVNCQQKVTERTYECVQKQLQACEKCLNQPGPHPVTNSSTPKATDEVPKQKEIIEPPSKQSRNFPNSSTYEPSAPKSNQTSSPVCTPCSRNETPGKITNNSFFNFIREIRKCHKVSPEQASQLWTRLPENEKMKYKIMNYTRLSL